MSGKHGIAITSSNVTLDLNGFSLNGVPGSLDGINATNSSATASGLVVLNGTIANWAGNGINALPGAPDSQFSHLQLLYNALDGLNATNSLISDCVANGNTSGSFTNYAINGNRSHIINCSARANYNGIQGGGGSTIEGCIAEDNNFGFLAADSIITRCTAYNSTGDGMFLFQNNQVVGNLVNGNGHGNGIEVAGNNRGNVLDGNTLIGASGARIFLNNPGATNNLVIRWVAHGNGTNFVLGGGNSYGPIINVVEVGDISANTNTSHPWANFSF